MAGKKPKVGDAVMYHGRMHEIIKLPERAVMSDGAAVIAPMAVFRSIDWDDLPNEKAFRVTVNRPDLAWSEVDGAWYMMGTVLSRDECVLYEALMGVRPPAETHMAARTLLDATDYETGVPMDRLVGAVARRKGLLGTEAEEYAVACLAHCAELKEARNG